MLSTALPFAFTLLRVAYAAPATSSPDSGTHQLQKRLKTGPKIALGICIPAAALVLFLGLGILWFYPEQRRRLRAENAMRQANSANANGGRHRQRQGSESATLPAYKEHEGSDHELDDVAHGNTTPAAPTPPTVPAATAQPSPGYEAQPPPEAKHAGVAV